MERIEPGEYLVSPLSISFVSHGSFPHPRALSSSTDNAEPTSDRTPRAPRRCPPHWGRGKTRLRQRCLRFLSSRSLQGWGGKQTRRKRGCLALGSPSRGLRWGCDPQRDSMLSRHWLLVSVAILPFLLSCHQNSNTS